MANEVKTSDPKRSWMRVPVVDQRGIPLMPCTAPKARALLKDGKARPKRSKLGLFYLQLTYEQEPNNQQLVVGVDPGSSFEGFSVVGTKETVCNLMAEAPRHVKKAVESRRRLRRARRFRLWRRPCRTQNRLAGRRHLPPSTRARWEAKARIVRQLATILPLSDAAVEDVQASTRAGEGGRWNAAFSPVQVGKEHLYRLLKEQGLIVHQYPGFVTSQLRERYGLGKTDNKAAQTFSSHAVDAWVLAAATSGALVPTSTRLWYLVPVRLCRRQLHRQEAAKGGKRLPYGGTRSLGFTRGTLVRHPRYGLCAVGGCDRKTGRVSVHAYRSNRRLTQRAKLATCHPLTRVAFRSWLVRHTTGTSSTKRRRQGRPGRTKRAALPPRA
jgi:hypothetical protein